MSELSAIVETGPDPEVDGVVRWRRIDLKRVIEERFGVIYSERTLSDLLAALSFSHISGRPQHPRQDADRAGWHSTDKLKVPKNLTIILLPSRSPELSPVENIWQYLRQNWLSNRVFEDYDDIIEAGCQAWNKLINQPQTIMSIGS